ncbi:hypothetical protein [Variovorax rhizosphaerae]|uniref:MacB-like periplasmic core domain-containing protein n=1 Tax=Variovorax rhizosphaerae TaxID=1836200 RepID=A0ABU8WJV8_9BURK
MNAMSSFLKAIPEAAASPYALAAYTIAAIIFLFAGAKLVATTKLLKALPLVREEDRPAVFKAIIGEPMPTQISPAKWTHNNRTKWAFLLAASIVMALFVVAMVALNLAKNPSVAEMERVIKRQAAESDRRHMTPLEDAELYAVINLDGSIRGLAEYIGWIESEYKSALVRGDCYDLTDNPLKIDLEMPDNTSASGLVCGREYAISIPTFSPLFPTMDRNGAVATEVLGRLRADIEFFNGTPIVDEYGANEANGVLLMRYDSNWVSEKDIPRSIRLRVDLPNKKLGIRTDVFKYAKASWRRHESVNSFVDLAGMQMVFWVQVGKKEFSGDEMGLARRSTSLEHFYLKIGGLKIAPDRAQWRPIKDRFGSPAWVYDMPKTPEGVLAMLR